MESVYLVAFVVGVVLFVIIAIGIVFQGAVLWAIDMLVPSRRAARAERTRRAMEEMRSTSPAAQAMARFDTHVEHVKQARKERELQVQAVAGQKINAWLDAHPNHTDAEFDAAVDDAYDAAETEAGPEPSF